MKYIHAVMTRFALLVIFTIGAQLGFGCSCIGKSDTVQSIHPKQMLVSGTIIKSMIVEQQIGDSMPGYPVFRRKSAIYLMAIDTVYQGKRIADTVEIHTGIGGGDCGYPFEIGKRYIVFASNYPLKFFKTNRILKTNICTYTDLYSEVLSRRISRLLN
ncbi:MAG: hypothetical protein EP332_14150 [Bacteroidetes bacterium]|nr:MAG: hypothetical protein EP332_14150 [Bacteroidota bacterium]